MEGHCMRMYDVIFKKRQGQELSTEEINYFVNGFTSGDIPDYQASALLMAVFFSKMSHKETVDLTEAMMNSGDVLDLSAIKGIVVDKHSTGGVGDTTTLILAPMVAACGIPMAKMSGRGLGHTGGTIDKLESIDGFHTQMTKEEFIQRVNDIGIAIAGQTGALAPADKKLYALRDVTATVDNLSLIASSVMSKKLASGAQGILLDVKTGNGAFMKTEEDSFDLAQMMIDIGSTMGRNVSAIITDMNQPLGRAVGNALEVKEAIDTLKGNGPDDLYKLCLILGAELLLLAGYTDSTQEAKDILQQKVEEGKAFEKFRELVISQGGNIAQVDNPNLLPQGIYKLEFLSSENQYIKSIEAEKIGLAALTLGAGRQTKESEIDLGVGIYLNKKVGEFASEGDSIATIYANDESKARLALEQIKGSYNYSEHPVPEGKLIYGLINKDGRSYF